MSCKEGIFYSIIFQRKKLRVRGVRQFDQVHTASEWQHRSRAGIPVQLCLPGKEPLGFCMMLFITSSHHLIINTAVLITRPHELTG